MSEEIPTIILVVTAIISILVLIAFGYVMLVMLTAFRTITQGRTAPWDMAIFIVAFFVLSPIIVERYPPRMMAAIYNAATGSRIYADALVIELTNWVVGAFQPAGTIDIVPDDETTIISTPQVAPTVPNVTVVFITSPPVVPPETTPTPPIQISPEATIDLDTWNVLTPAPTIGVQP